MPYLRGGTKVPQRNLCRLSCWVSRSSEGLGWGPPPNIAAASFINTVTAWGKEDTLYTRSLSQGSSRY